MTPTIIAVDWGVTASKRAAYVSRPQRSGFLISPLDPTAAGWNLAALLHRASNEATIANRPVLIGIDAALGLPRAYLARLESDRDSGFLEFLRRATSDRSRLETCAPNAWNVRTHFFAVPKGAGRFTAMIEAAGGRAVFWRDIDVHTRANCLFALSGIPGTVGSGTRVLWRELAARSLEPCETSSSGPLRA